MTYFNLCVCSSLPLIALAVRHRNFPAIPWCRKNALLRIHPYAGHANINWFLDLVLLSVNYIALVLPFFLLIATSLVECPFSTDVDFHRIQLVNYLLQLRLQGLGVSWQLSDEVYWLQKRLIQPYVNSTFVGYRPFYPCQPKIVVY